MGLTSAAIEGPPEIPASELESTQEAATTLPALQV